MKKMVLALAAVTVLSGCAAATPNSPTGPKLIDQNEYALAVRKSYHDFNWPNDYQPRLDQMIVKSGPGDNGRTTEGAERVILEVANACAWYLSWNDAQKRDDGTAAAAALKVMEEVLPTYGADDPEGRAFARDAAVKAKLGDATMALDFVTANCEGVIEWIRQ